MGESMYVTTGRIDLIARLERVDAAIERIRGRAEMCRRNAEANHSDLGVILARAEAYENALDDLKEL